MRNKDKYFNKLENLLKYLKKAKIVIMSKDVYSEMRLRGTTVKTSKGRIKIKIVEGYCILGINDGSFVAKEYGRVANG